jgi:hypothetical protein
MAAVTIKVVGKTGIVHKFRQTATGLYYEYVAVNANNKAFVRKETTAERFNAAKQYLQACNAYPW